MRISDWSSDVCSSDLSALPPSPIAKTPAEPSEMVDAASASISISAVPPVPSPPFCDWKKPAFPPPRRSEEHTSELQSLMRISYAVFCLKKKKNTEFTLYILSITSLLTIYH